VSFPATTALKLYCITVCRKIVLGTCAIRLLDYFSWLARQLRNRPRPEKRALVKRILKILTYIAAGLYLLVDAIFMTIARPIADWIARHVALKRLRDWIKSLPPYPSLALFSVPLIVLEPVKPIAAYLAATGQFVSGAVTFIFGELLKLVLVERLFSLTREKLMRIPAFARLYESYSKAIAWLKGTEAWRAVQSLIRSAREYFRATSARVAHSIKLFRQKRMRQIKRKREFPD
jgi:hypothetical protein